MKQQRSTRKGKEVGGVLQRAKMGAVRKVKKRRKNWATKIWEGWSFHLYYKWKFGKEKEKKVKNDWKKAKRKRL